MYALKKGGSPRIACWTRMVVNGSFSVNEILCHAYENYGLRGFPTPSFSSEKGVSKAVVSVTDNVSSEFAWLMIVGVVGGETDDSQPCTSVGPVVLFQSPNQTNPAAPGGRFFASRRVRLGSPPTYEPCKPQTSGTPPLRRYRRRVERLPARYGRPNGSGGSRDYLREHVGPG